MKDSCSCCSENVPKASPDNGLGQEVRGRRANASAFMELLGNSGFRWLILALLVVLPFEALSLSGSHLSPWIEFPLFLAIIFVFGNKVILGGLDSLLRLRFSSINLLMTIAVAGAIYLGELEEAAIIVLLFSLGERLEEYGYEKSRDSIAALIEKQPKTALVNGKKGRQPVAFVKVGDVVVVKQGEQVPLDGVVIRGKAFIDEAAITGEALPKDKVAGDSVFAATMNTNGYLEIKVTKAASETTYAKILELTEKALENKSGSQQLIEKFANYYTPSVLAGFILMLVIPVAILQQPFSAWFERALTLLVISCPCALVISTPVAIFSAMGNASRKGILIKGGKYVEELGRLKIIAFDKTRTLTTGKFQVTDVIPFNGFTESDLLSCAAGIESYSEHPLAIGVVSKAKRESAKAHAFRNLEFVQGKGIKGDCRVCFDAHHCLGNLKFVTQEHKVPKGVLKELGRLESEGKTVIVSCNSRGVKGLIALSDTVKEESRSVISTIKRLGITPAILSGDSKASVSYTAGRMGISHYEAGLLPEDKVARISELLRAHKHVAMVGDGVNDTPALAKSSVGIAMGAAGSDSAIETADVVILNDNIRMIEYLVKLGKEASGKIKFNIGIAIGIKAAILAAAALGYTNLAFAIFADVGVTVIVIANGLSLFNYGNEAA